MQPVDQFYRDPSTIILLPWHHKKVPFKVTWSQENCCKRCQILWMWHQVLITRMRYKKDPFRSECCSVGSDQCVFFSGIPWHALSLSCGPQLLLLTVIRIISRWTLLGNVTWHGPWGFSLSASLRVFWVPNNCFSSFLQNLILCFGSGTGWDDLTLNHLFWHFSTWHWCCTLCTVHHFR